MNAAYETVGEEEMEDVMEEEVRDKVPGLKVLNYHWSRHVLIDTHFALQYAQI